MSTPNPTLKTRSSPWRWAVRTIRPLIPGGILRFYRILRHWNRSRRGPPPSAVPIDLLIVSPGGVGTTFLSEYIARYVSLNKSSDGDTLKHMPRPPEWLKPDRSMRVIFVDGADEEIYDSIARRGWVNVQGAKLGSLCAIFTRGSIQKSAFLGSVHRQRRAWQTWGDCGGRLLVVEYDRLWDEIDQIGDFVGAPRETFKHYFPDRIPRNS